MRTINQIMLVFVMLLGLCGPAFADESPNSTDSTTTKQEGLGNVEWQPYDGSTFAAQLTLGTVGGLAGGGMALGLSAATLCNGPSDHEFLPPCIGPVLLLTALGGVTGVVLGTQLVGDSVGGTGSVGGTIMGAVVGASLWIAMAAALGPVGGAIGLIAPALGATLGYHMTAEPVFEGAGVAPTADGAAFQATWRF